MTVRTRAELNSDADTNLADNTSGDISAADVRASVKNLADSAVLPSDTPHLAGIELGHASDTTLSRGAAGFIAIEGKRVPSPASQASGDLLYRGATEWERLAKGTAAQVLRMNSGATAPEWATASSGGMTLLGTLTTTSGTTQALTSIPAGYRQLYCEFDGVVFSGSTTFLRVALSSTNGAAYGTDIQCARTKTAAGDVHNGAIIINNVSSAVAAGKSFLSCIANTAGILGSPVGALSTNTAAVVDAIRFTASNFAFENFSAGTIRIYGVK